MPVYFCRISNEKGRIEEFLRESASEETCLRELNEKNPYVLSIRELPPSSAGARPRRFSRRLIQELTELMALTLSSGLSLKDSLDVSQTVFTRGEGNALVTLLRQRLNKGSTFTEALESAGTGFPPFYMGMVRIGERIGSLEQVTSRLSKHLREEKVLRDRFSSALIYPAIVLGIAVSSAVFIVAVLFPRLREIFNEMGSNAAGNMESLMGGLTTVFAVLGVVAALALVLVIGIVIARRKGGGLAVRIDRLFLGIPLYSRFMMQRELMNFSFAMEALTAAGVGVEEALTEEPARCPTAHCRLSCDPCANACSKENVSPLLSRTARSFRNASRDGCRSGSASATWRRCSDSFAGTTSRRWKNGSIA